MHHGLGPQPSHFRQFCCNVDWAIPLNKATPPVDEYPKGDLPNLCILLVLIPPLLPLTGLGISLGVEHDLRGPVPPCGNILREETSVVMLRVCYPGQTKVTDL